MQLQTIEIDFDIHKMIEAERHGFDEPRYLALRRLLKLPTPKAVNKEIPNNSVGDGIPFVEDGVSIPHGSLAMMNYQRGQQLYEGKFLNGKLVVNGQEFSSLSAAANACAVTKDGGKTKLNGWLYWKAQFLGETHWRALNEMRSNS